MVSEGLVKHRPEFFDKCGFPSVAGTTNLQLEISGAVQNASESLGLLHNPLDLF